MLVGAEAQSHNEAVMTGVSKKLGGDEAKVKEFKTATKNLGKGQVGAEQVSLLKLVM
jgi:hypothetical protein